MYEVSATKFDEPRGNTLGMASINYGNMFQINSIRIMQSKNGDVFVSLPQQKKGKNNDEDGSAVYESVFCPITKDFREELFDKILEAYDSGKKVIGEPEVTTPAKYNVTITPYKKLYNQRAGKASLYLDDRFVVNNIKLIVNARGGFSVGMPSVKTSKKDEQGNDIWNDIVFPKNTEFAREFYSFVTEQAKEKINLDELQKENNQKQAAENSNTQENKPNVEQPISHAKPKRH